MTEAEAFDCGAYAAHAWLPGVPAGDPAIAAAWLRGAIAYFKMSDEEVRDMLIRKRGRNE